MKSLYDQCIETLTFTNLNNYDLNCLTLNTYFDIYAEFFHQGRICFLAMELSNLDKIDRLLNCSGRRTLLIQIIQAIIQHGINCHTLLYLTLMRQQSLYNLKDFINLSFKISYFFNQLGFYSESEKIVRKLFELGLSNTFGKEIVFPLLLTTMEVQLKYLKYPEALETYNLLTQCCLTQSNKFFNAEFCHRVSTLCYSQSQYNSSYYWTFKSLQKIIELPLYDRTLITDVLRQATKICIIKRQFPLAKIFIKYGLKLSFGIEGPLNLTFTDCLLDYGYYCISVDKIRQSVYAYKRALDLRIQIFGPNNIQVAMAHEDLAYALYVYEYSSGTFKYAQKHADIALKIYKTLLPMDHLMLASCKRVKALILEEIAIDGYTRSGGNLVLKAAESLHLEAMTLTIKALGENNVQTAKHYGNLGRLYQSMSRFKESESMHLQAIAIKERLLGREDYEVALSLGHLASLYNYDMERFDEAERLYLRSIGIGYKLFGETYSGLEYDYRGLIRLYKKTDRAELAHHYRSLLYKWFETRYLNQDELVEISLDLGANNSSNTASLAQTLNNQNLIHSGHITYSNPNYENMNNSVDDNSNSFSHNNNNNNNNHVNLFALIFQGSDTGPETPPSFSLFSNPSVQPNNGVHDNLNNTLISDTLPRIGNVSSTTPVSHRLQASTLSNHSSLNSLPENVIDRSSAINEILIDNHSNPNAINNSTDALDSGNLNSTPVSPYQNLTPYNYNAGVDNYVAVNLLDHQDADSPILKFMNEPMNETLTANGNSNNTNGNVIQSDTDSAHIRKLNAQIIKTLTSILKFNGQNSSVKTDDANEISSATNCISNDNYNVQNVNSFENSKKDNSTALLPTSPLNFEPFWENEEVFDTVTEPKNSAKVIFKGKPTTLPAPTNFLAKIIEKLEEF